jgi:hypothetical protein
MVAVGGLFEAASLPRLKVIITHQPGDSVVVGDDTVLHEIGAQAGAPISLPRQVKRCGVRQHRFNFFFRRSRFSDMFSAKLVLMLLSCGQRPALSTGGACKFGEGCEDTAGLGSALRRNRERWRGVPQMRDLTPDTPKMVASLSDAWPSRARRTKQGSAATCFAQSLCAHRGSHP